MKTESRGPGARAREGSPSSWLQLVQGGVVASTLFVLGAAVVAAADAPLPARRALAVAAERFVERATHEARAPRGKRLTQASALPAERAVLDYLRRNASRFGLSPADVSTLVVERVLTTPHNRATYVTLGQRLGGLRVHGALFSATLDPQGRLLLLSGRASNRRASGNPVLSAADALDRAARMGGAKSMPLPAAADTRAAGKHEFRNPYARGTRHPVPLKAELVWHMAADGSLRLAWITDVEVSDTSWYETILDAQTGAVLERTSRYRSAVQGRVFTEQHPDAAPSGRTLVDFSGVNGSWVDEVDGATTTTGNNTITYRDFSETDTLGYQPLATNDDSLFDFSFGDLWAGLTAVDPNDFNNVPQATWEAALNGDLDAAVTQLFFYVNQTHDWLYGYGFDEASGNFQDVNFSGMGVGGDRVVAETHNGFDFGCGGGTTRCINNANFGTDGDGTAARMQMYLSIPPNQPYADRSFNGDTIVHEYGHGVSNRLVPGTLSGATNQAGSLGEGWSDTLAFLRWDDPVYGDYTSFDKANGIRNFSYATNPWTYGDYSTSVGSPHRNGEIWAATLYGVRLRLGIDTTIWLVLDGMRNTVGPSPTFLDARDGILAADTLNNADANYCALWSAFAERGMGTGAVSNGLHAVPSEDFTAPAECRPVASAGGPYTTDEGSDVQLSVAGSTGGSHASAGDIASYAWDLDNDGQYDDGTGATADFTAVGQDGVHTVGVQVTDTYGLTSTASTTVTVDNVLPTVVIDAISPIDEHGTVTISGTITDPGWLEPLTATIDFDDGAGAQPLSGALENARPDAVFSFQVQNQYGDNGVYDVQVCGRDTVAGAPNAQAVCYTAMAHVDNVDPTMAIQTAGMQSYNGKQAFVLQLGESLEVPGTASDPGSDDLTFTWAWDDGTPDDVQVSLVNPPALDPAKSPTVQPRDVSLAQSHLYGGACLYEMTLAVGDDDGGSASDSAAVVVTGNADLSKGSGWWLNQYRNKPPNDFSPAQLQCYLDIVTFFSSVFTTPLDRAQATLILNAPAKAPMLITFREQLLAAWLNFANGAVSFDTPVDTDGDGMVDATWAAAILHAETVANNPASTNAQVKAQKDIVERIVLRDE